MMYIIINGQYYVNYVLTLIEVLFTVIFLFISHNLITTGLLDDKNQKARRSNNLGVYISLLIALGIGLGTRYIIGFLGYYLIGIRIFDTLFLSLAIMATVFTPFYKIFLKKFDKENLVLNSRSLRKVFLIRSLFLIIVSWIAFSIFLSIDLLGIHLDNLIPSDPQNPQYDLFLLGFEWAFLFVIINVVLSKIIIMFFSEKKKPPKIVIKKATIFSSVIAFGLWAIQNIVFELYLKRAIHRVFFETKELIILRIITFVTLFVIGIFSIGIYAKKKKLYDSYIFASLISLEWLLLNLWLGTGLYFIIGDYLLVDILITLISIFIGSITFKFLYDQEIAKSLKISILFNIILFFLAYIPTFLDANKSIPEQDIRVLIIVVTVVYFVSFFISIYKLFLPKRRKEKQKLLQEFIKKEELEAEKVLEQETILDVNNLTTRFYTEEGVVHAVEGISFKIYKGEVLGFVGETGCGKSVSALSILQLIQPPGKIIQGSVNFLNEDLLKKTSKEILSYRGDKITMIFQDPINSLNPVFTVGKQISEVLLLHKEEELMIESSRQGDKGLYDVIRNRTLKILKDMNIPSPENIIDRYPHELSGGMRQRIQIAMAIACSPILLIADEPTTALDVTIQNQILKLMKDLQKNYDTSILFITHDLSVISKMCDTVAVMYCGSIVEYGAIKNIFRKTLHPYTKGLLSAVPIEGKTDELKAIPGMIPNPIYPPSGCKFHPRCAYCFEPCNSEIPKSIEIEPNYYVSCHLYDPKFKKVEASPNVKKM
ncbi:MAG: ABC transporter ATP-binding protein [Promethearchaeota archaeon]